MLQPTVVLLSIVRYLHSLSLPVDALTTQQQTVLYVAASEGHCEVVRFLIEAGADVNAVDNNERTPLHHASYMGLLEIVRFLIDADEDDYPEDIREMTPLRLASYNIPLPIRIQFFFRVPFRSTLLEQF